jgi:hypothetical protein
MKSLILGKRKLQAAKPEDRSPELILVFSGRWGKAPEIE